MSIAQPVPPTMPAWRTPIIVLTAGCLIAMVGFGARSVFGLFLEPMTVSNGWNRETFALGFRLPARWPIVLARFG